MGNLITAMVTHGKRPGASLTVIGRPGLQGRSAIGLDWRWGPVFEVCECQQ